MKDNEINPKQDPLENLEEKGKEKKDRLFLLLLFMLLVLASCMLLSVLFIPTFPFTYAVEHQPPYIEEIAEPEVAGESVVKDPVKKKKKKKAVTAVVPAPTAPAHAPAPVRRALAPPPPPAPRITLIDTQPTSYSGTKIISKLTDGVVSHPNYAIISRNGSAAISIKVKFNRKVKIVGWRVTSRGIREGDARYSWNIGHSTAWNGAYSYKVSGRVTNYEGTHTFTFPATRARYWIITASRLNANANAEHITEITPIYAANP